MSSTEILYRINKWLNAEKQRLGKFDVAMFKRPFPLVSLRLRQCLLAIMLVGQINILPAKAHHASQFRFGKNELNLCITAGTGDEF